MDSLPPWTRREFLGRSTTCAAHLGLLAAASPWLGRRSWATQERFPVVAREPFARLERVADGVWALISTPLEGARATLCNGGIIAGQGGVLVVEAFAGDEGSRWMVRRAVELTGRPPTHVVLTHYHADHTGGLRGYFEHGEAPEILATAVTRDETLERNREPPADILRAVTPLDGRDPTEIDLVGRRVVVVPRKGHTDSDVTLELADPPVVFCGDLVWNDMFPNYMDAIPSHLSTNVRLLRSGGATTFVPGHGPIADGDAMDRYIDLLDDVEAAARRAVEDGLSAAAAGARYRLPESAADWTLFNPHYFERAIGAWMKEMSPVGRG